MVQVRFEAAHATAEAEIVSSLDKRHMVLDGVDSLRVIDGLAGRGHIRTCDCDTRVGVIHVRSIHPNIRILERPFVL